MLGLLLVLAWCGTARADEPEPLTLSVSSIRETCTLGSVTTLDYDIQGGQPPYQLAVDGRAVEQRAEPDYIPCRQSAILLPLEPYGGDSIQRILVRVSDSTGARAYAIAEHRLVPPLPAPTFFKVTSGLSGTSAANLKAEWRVPYLPPGERAQDFAIRWRLQGASEWTVGHHRGEQTRIASFNDTWRIDATPTGEQREAQIAQLRHIHDLQAPEALSWSDTSLVTTAATPYELQAEATHDTITLTWGPHVPGLSYVARLGAVEPRPYGRQQELVLDAGPLFEAEFSDLLPETLYLVEVALLDDQFLDQHQFEFRTEPAPEGWVPPTRLATEIRALYIDREIKVTWTPPEVGARFSTQVCVVESNIRHFPNWQCSRAAPGENHAIVTRLNNDRWRGGSYDISVSVQTSPVERTVQRVHIPTYEPKLATRGEPPVALRFTELRWLLHPENPEPGTWEFEGDAVSGNLFEVLWRVGDEWFLREYRVSDDQEVSFSIGTRAGVHPQAIRYRILRNGTWTPWSPSIDAPDVTGKPNSIRFRQYADNIQVDWEPPPGTESLEYEVTIQRESGFEQKYDVGRQTSLKIPTIPNGERISVIVSAMTADRRPVGFTYTSYTPKQLGLRLYAHFSKCPPATHAPIRVYWSILGGAPPFTLSIGELLGFETEERYGSVIATCRSDEEGALQSIVAQLMDVAGQTASDVLGPNDAIPWYDDDPGTVKLAPRNVYRDRVMVTWVACRGRYTAVMRWRPEGMERWRYAPHLPINLHGDGWHCSSVLGGLAPVTAYEYQVARLVSAEELQRPERLRWTDTQAVTTLGPPQDLKVERIGETVIATWRRQPDAWAYVVGLRSEGRSWWKRYEPSGEETESVYFYRVPHALELNVELISPPLRHGKEEIPIGIDPSWVPGH